MLIGDNTATGTLNLTGGNVVVASGSGNITIAYEAASTGTLNLGNGSTVGSLQAARVTGGNGTAVVNFNHTGNYTFAPILAGNLSVNKYGNGNTTLSGANTYTGTTTINAGSIVLGANQTLAGIAGAGNLDLANYTLTTNSPLNSTFSGAISGTGSLTKEGAGTLTLTGANTYNGTTVINAGTIQIGSGGTTGSLSTGSAIINNGTLVFNRSNTVTQGTDFADGISGTGNVVQSGSGLLILSGNNTYTGSTTLTSGTLQVGSGGSLGGGNYSENITNTGTIILGSNSNQTLSGVISGSGAITKNGTGTLTLTGSNTHSGNMTINTGTVVIGHANAAGTGRIIQANGSSLLKIDTTGTISNNMSVYKVQAAQSATLSGDITVNNAEWDVNTGATTTAYGDIDGDGGVTKNGGGTLILSGNNTYAAPTVVNAGTLEAASANALGANNTVQVNGGTLLVVADDALEDKNITLGTSSVGLRFSNTYNGSIGNLTLSANSTLDLGTGSVIARFARLIMGGHTLSIYNWTGEAYLWGTNRNNTDQVYIMAPVTPDDLENISFYSGAVGSDSFMGTGFELGFSSGYENQIIPVPEPETWATGILLVLGGAAWLWRKRRNFTTEFTETTEKG